MVLLTKAQYPKAALYLPVVLLRKETPPTERHTSTQVSPPVALGMARNVLPPPESNKTAEPVPLPCSAMLMLASLP